jgi:hypothetical protein
MSKPCAAIKCERTSRALCDCCEQNLCLQHLHEHNAVLVSKLNPLTDEINALGDRLNRLNIQQTLGEGRKKLEQWCSDCHQKIDHYFRQKYQELEQLIGTKKEKQQEYILQIQLKVDKLIRDQEATRQDIDILTSTVRNLEKEINKIEQTCFSIDTRPLLIRDSIVQIKEICAHEFDPSTLSLVYKTIPYPTGSWRSLASNDRLLMIHHAPNLCFVNAELIIIKQVLWPHNVIKGICWSSTLDRFIVIVKDNVFLVDENTMSIESVETVEKRNWFTCTCFNDQLFLSTHEWGSSIVEVNLSPRIAIIKEWKSPIACPMDEYIGDMVYNNKTLAVVISNKVNKSIRMELRSCTTLDCLWSLALDVPYKDLVFHCCSLDFNEWLVAASSAGCLLHITADGNIKETIAYKEIPYRVTLFSYNMIAASVKTGINFHKIV